MRNIFHFQVFWDAKKMGLITMKNVIFTDRILYILSSSGPPKAANPTLKGRKA
jgi:hypothetical protein